MLVTINESLGIHDGRVSINTPRFHVLEGTQLFRLLQENLAHTKVPTP